MATDKIIDQLLRDPEKIINGIVAQLSAVSGSGMNRKFVYSIHTTNFENNGGSNVVD